ncbi:hypothetical protein GCM10022255_099860 [Dactylosporangium darangshiense]|uniref:Uncharacterized protein n=1 Tax=Dactylosporangium darangshiense TaxID=579108 RepID=A0ABP8DS96_9ACTN
MPSGDPAGRRRLAAWLVERGDADELRARAGAGDRPALERLVDLLAERGAEDELRRLCEAGDRRALLRLAEVVAQRGDADADGADVDFRRLSAERGLLDELRLHADRATSSPAVTSTTCSSGWGASTR